MQGRVAPPLPNACSPRAAASIRAMGSVAKIARQPAEDHFSRLGPASKVFKGARR